VETIDSPTNPIITTTGPADISPAGRLPPWSRAAGGLLGVGWGANQFSSLLLAYRIHRGVSTTTADALFGVYALGLIPALLLCGPASDLHGRRKIARPAVVLSVVATIILMVGRDSLPLLYVGRFLAGACSGAIFAAGTAWVKELSSGRYAGAAGEQAGARRAAIALSAGFGFGPVVAGLLAQWAPAPLVTPYIPHLLVMAAVVPVLWGAPETVTDPGTASFVARLKVPAVSNRRFLLVVAPLSPWVFLAASVAFALMPGVVAGHIAPYGLAFAALTAGITLALGIGIQPYARKLDAGAASRGAVAGLVAVIAGLLVAALAAALTNWPLVLLAAVFLGAGYGLCLVSGLLEVQRIAGPGELAGLTAVFYALTYLGFAAPIVLAALHHLVSYPVLLLITAALAGLSLLSVQSQRRSRPA
jgi:MFS family permease